MDRQGRTHLNPAPSPAIQPPAQPQSQSAPSSPPGEAESHPTSGPCHGFFRDKEGMPQQPPTSYTQTCPCLIDLIKECIHHRIKKSITNFRKALKVGLNLAITLRHLATLETYTSLQCHRFIGRNHLLQIRSQVCRAILAAFQEKYLYCPDEKGGREVQNQMEYLPRCRCHRWEV